MGHGSYLAIVGVSNARDEKSELPFRTSRRHGEIGIWVDFWLSEIVSNGEKRFVRVVILTKEEAKLIGIVWLYGK